MVNCIFVIELAKSIQPNVLYLILWMRNYIQLNHIIHTDYLSIKSFQLLKMSLLAYSKKLQRSIDFVRLKHKMPSINSSQPNHPILQYKTSNLHNVFLFLYRLVKLLTHKIIRNKQGREHCVLNTTDYSTGGSVKSV